MAVAAGADAIIAYLSLAALDPGDEVVFGWPSFASYPLAAIKMGATPVRVPLTDYHYDVERMLAAITERTKIVYLCNPNNPTGTMIGRGDVDAYFARVPDHVLTVLDEAYYEYLQEPEYPDGIEEHFKAGRRVLVLRTFSKIYGLAGLRVGYGIGPKEVVDAMKKVRNAFDVTQQAQDAAAASLDDPGELERRRKVTGESRAHLVELCADLGLTIASPAVANFVFAEVAEDARPVFDALLREGVIVRPLGPFGAPGAIRITVGSREENELLRRRCDASPRRRRTARRHWAECLCWNRAPPLFRQGLLVPTSWTLESLADGVREGDRRALARAITLVENSDPLAYELVKQLYGETGNAYTIGVTGPPGVGKSSLISALVKRVRGDGRSVGVISVDPSSPFTKGALLGDRIRLADHFLDPEVFIRSMGTRGHLGGLAEATLQAALLLDAAGKELVFLETVGAGQSEVEVITIADTVLLVLMPGSGDSIQALKAGIMEIPDVIAVNKRDHPAAKTMVNEVRSILALDTERDWKPPIVLTEAVQGEGVGELWEKIEEHRAHLEESGTLAERRARNLAGEVFAVASARAKTRLQEAVAEDEELRRLLGEVQRRELDPLSAVREIMERVFKVRDDGSNAR